MCYQAKKVRAIVQNGPALFVRVVLGKIEFGHNKTVFIGQNYFKQAKTRSYMVRFNSLLHSFDDAQVVL